VAPPDARGLRFVSCVQQPGKRSATATFESVEIANDASRKAPMQLKGGRGLASPKGAVDPRQHRDDSTYKPRRDSFLRLQSYSSFPDNYTVAR
jgi:hypothetical protein